MKYKELINNILVNIGGEDNISAMTHCATRLRLTLYNESTVNEEALKVLPDVLSIIKTGGQFQIVLGTKVSGVYDEMMAYLKGFGEKQLKSEAEMREEVKQKKVQSRLFDLISGIFTPIFGVLVASGVIKGLLTLFNIAGILSADSGLYQLLYIVGDTLFIFMPVMLGYTSMKKFGGDVTYGLIIGAALVCPNIANILAGEPLYSLFTGTPFEAAVQLEILGAIPVMLKDYTCSVFPVVVICFVASRLEKFFKKCIPEMVSLFVVPMLTLIISIVLGFIIIGPIVTFASDIVGLLFSKLYEVSAGICGLFYGALIQLCVLLGIHWGFMPIIMNNFATLGYDPVSIAGLSSAFGQVGVVLAIMLKTRNEQLKKRCMPAIISGLFGITEPAIYGVTLQNKMAFFLASIASGIGGAIIGFMGVKAYVLGANGIFGWLQTINPQTGFDGTVIISITACIVSFIAGFVLMNTIGKKHIPEE